MVYPEVREPYAAIYRDYLNGIREATRHPVEAIAVSGRGDKNWRRLEDGHHSLYVALGNRAVSRLQSLEVDEPVVGAFTEAGYGAQLAGGILLRPRADIYLENLFAISDRVRDVYVVYDPDSSRELIDAASGILDERDVSFHALPASNLREAAARYREIFQTADRYSALWLQADKGLLDSSLLSFILDVAWEKRLLVFSSNPVFVQHGALFALYPDNRAIGRQLGAIAAGVLAGDGGKLVTLRHVRLAVNDRTRSHLGIELAPAVKQKVDLLLSGN